MQVVYANQAFPRSFTRALFLAGPTPRSAEVSSWRPEALRILSERAYDGVVFLPEDAAGVYAHDYLDQVEWEEKALHLADAIAFWIPRDLATLPGFTTNVEWGVWHDSGKAILGAPARAPKLRYLTHYADKLAIPRASTLEATIDAALSQMGPGALRTEGECEVPLFVWQRPEFQQWYAAQRRAGHRLDGARLLWHFRPRRNPHPFCWALKAKLYIPEENRHKAGEVVISRSDIASVLAYHRGSSLEDTRVVLVREVRSNAATNDGFVHELPGGSSLDAHLDARALAAEELEQETGVNLAIERFTAHAPRQCMATFSTHRAALYSIELTGDELARFVAHAGRRFGEHDSERTYVEVRTVADILGAEDVDWTHVGMILSVLTAR